MTYKAYTKCAQSGYVVIATWCDDIASTHFIASWHPALKKQKLNDELHFIADVNAKLHSQSVFIPHDKKNAFNKFFDLHPHFSWMKDVTSKEWSELRARGKQIDDTGT